MSPASSQGRPLHDASLMSADIIYIYMAYIYQNPFRIPLLFMHTVNTVNTVNMYV